VKFHKLISAFFFFIFFENACTYDILKSLQNYDCITNAKKMDNPFFWIGSAAVSLYWAQRNFNITNKNIDTYRKELSALQNAQVQNISAQSVNERYTKKRLTSIQFYTPCVLFAISSARLMLYIKQL
jgi:hypothetical protein